MNYYIFSNYSADLENNSVNNTKIEEISRSKAMQKLLCPLVLHKLVWKTCASLILESKLSKYITQKLQQNPSEQRNIKM